MALATASAAMESQSLMQTESRIQHSYQEVRVSSEQRSEQRTEQRSEQRSEKRTEKRSEKVKKKKSMRRNKDEGSISVSKSSEKLHRKMKAAAADGESSPACAQCGRPVYAMERVKAERRAWHRECFRCSQCGKQLTVESYESEHTALYCRAHFKQLFGPRPVDHDETDALANEGVRKKHQMIICESNPVELPPDVVRASDKPDLGIEELTQLDLKARFQVFERGPHRDEEEHRPEPRPREKSHALLSKLAKFKARGMDVGVPDECLHGVPVEGSDSEHSADDDDEDALLRRSYRATAAREQPVSFCNMSEIVGRFERGPDPGERSRERKQEIQNIRSRLFMGKQAKIKEMYEQSVMQSEQGVTSADKLSLSLDAEKARAIKERFERGEVFHDENTPPPRTDVLDKELFTDGIAKKSRSIFLELDANAASTPPSTPLHADPPRRKELTFTPKDVVRATDRPEEVQIETRDISDRFRFFETYKPDARADTTRKLFRITPPRHTQRSRSVSPEVYVDPSVARGSPPRADTHTAQERHTASRMIDVFRQMELQRDLPDNQGPKPLKCFTPPPAGESNHHRHSSSEDDDSEYSDHDGDGEEEEEEGDSEEERRRSYLQAREADEALKQAQQLARTKSFRSRFENWAEHEPPRPPSAANLPAPHTHTPLSPLTPHDDDDGESQLETAKSLREKFENMKVQQQAVPKTFVPKVNRFV